MQRFRKKLQRFQRIFSHSLFFWKLITHSKVPRSCVPREPFRRFVGWRWILTLCLNTRIALRVTHFCWCTFNTFLKRKIKFRQIVEFICINWIFVWCARFIPDKMHAIQQSIFCGIWFIAFAHINRYTPIESRIKTMNWIIWSMHRTHSNISSRRDDELLQYFSIWIETILSIFFSLNQERTSLYKSLTQVLSVISTEKVIINKPLIFTVNFYQMHVYHVSAFLPFICFYAKLFENVKFHGCHDISMLIPEKIMKWNKNDSVWKNANWQVDMLLLSFC